VIGGVVVSASGGDGQEAGRDEEMDCAHGGVSILHYMNNVMNNVRFRSFPTFIIVHDTTTCRKKREAPIR
ncbi:MAG: hypothetical protein LUE17_15925, partial [Planctomycetaceae bacterium]|nr:hypothetical protein [Planctomycetaceae bacterium]